MLQYRGYEIEVRRDVLSDPRAPYFYELTRLGKDSVWIQGECSHATPSDAEDDGKRHVDQLVTGEQR